MTTTSRRALLLGGAGMLLSACGVEKIVHSGNTTDRKVSGSFRSRSMKAMTSWTIAYPTGHAPGSKLPVVVSLHGRSSDHHTTFRGLHLDHCLDQAVGAGTPPFAIASVDGGDHSYWHLRTDGTDASAMVREEFLPLLAKHGLDADRLGLFGWSMGGYGALLMAGKQDLPVKAVAVSSPALFTTAGATAAGAYDSADDFEANNVYGHPEWLKRLRLRMDCGLQDPFYAATKDLAGRLVPHPAGGFTTGAHNRDFWRRVAPGQLSWLGARL